MHFYPILNIFKLIDLCCISKSITSMYKNLICSFFSFLTQKYTDGLSTEGRRWLSCTSWGIGRNLQWTLFSSFCSGRNLPGYITSQTPTQTLVITLSPACCLYNTHDHIFFDHATLANSCFETSSNLTPIQYTWSRFLRAFYTCKLSLSNLTKPAPYTLRVITLPSSMLPSQTLSFKLHPACRQYIASEHTIFDPAILANSRFQTLSILSPTQFAWWRFFSSGPPTQFTWHIRPEHPLPVYFG